MTDYVEARTKMVDGQLLTNKVTDPSVLAAFLAVQRENFAPETLRGAAYIDEDLPLGRGRYLIEPMVLARLLQFASITINDTVLDVGAGTGYTTALLVGFAKSIVALESDSQLVARAQSLLGHAANVTVVHGPLAAGYPQGAPYNVIVINGAINEASEALLAQLAEGGRLLTVINKDRAVMGHAVLFEKSGGLISRRVLFDAATSLLPEFAPQATFTF